MVTAGNNTSSIGWASVSTTVTVGLSIHATIKEVLIIWDMSKLAGFIGFFYPFERKGVIKYTERQRGGLTID